MGLAILMIYIPTLLVTLIVSIFIGSLIIKKTHSEETIGKNKKNCTSYWSNSKHFTNCQRGLVVLKNQQPWVWYAYHTDYDFVIYPISYWFVYCIHCIYFTNNRI